MKKSLVCSAVLALALLVWCLTPVAAQPNYEAELQKCNVILSATNPDMVKEWLRDPNSGYPDLAKTLLEVLRGCPPKGNTTVLDAIMGKLKILNNIDPNGFLQPPYNSAQVKQAFVNNWKDRNSGEWGTLDKSVRDSYEKAFRHICTR
ncbi:MAG: hypothetical protein HQK59_09370 [Deltaproteobacteria bacterium]|nr:hypothetical protein [Deltaproteobacteria bacterium]